LNYDQIELISTQSLTAILSGARVKKTVRPSAQSSRHCKETVAKDIVSGQVKISFLAISPQRIQTTIFQFRTNSISPRAQFFNTETNSHAVPLKSTAVITAFTSQGESLFDLKSIWSISKVCLFLPSPLL
jgi:hypothetical protein